MEELRDNFLCLNLLVKVNGGRWKGRWGLVRKIMSEFLSIQEVDQEGYVFANKMRVSWRNVTIYESRRDIEMMFPFWSDRDWVLDFRE